MKAAFWLSLGLVLYVYVGYPLMIACWASVRPRKVARQDVDVLPKVSIVVAARNEASRIAARIENLLSLDYPRDRLEIVVVSDGSTDHTIEALRRYGNALKVIELPASGKAVALNAGVAAASHEILVFADARQSFMRNAVRMLVRNFSDEKVGAVSGELVLGTHPSRDQRTIGEGLGLYWHYEKWIRLNESTAGSTVGATGAIYAMRRRLWCDLPAGTLLDDVLAPMRVVLAGKRAVFEPAAVAFDLAEADPRTEVLRKTRTLAGNYQMIRLEPALLAPWLNPVWFQFVSHKLGRLLVPYALASLLVSSAWLAPGSWVYAVALAGQLGFYALAAYGAALAHRPVSRPAVSPLDASVAKPGRGGKGVVNA